MTAASSDGYTSRLPTCPTCGQILDDASRTPDHKLECPLCRGVHSPVEVYADGA